MNILELIRQDKTLLERQETQVFNNLQRAYLQAGQELKGKVAEVLAAHSGDLNAAMPDIVRLTGQFHADMYGIASETGPKIEQGVRFFAVAGGQDAIAEMAQFGIEREALVTDQLLTNLQRPAATRLLQQLASPVADQVRDSLIQSIGLGRNPAEAGRILAPIMNTTLTHAQTITRTELMTAYRGAQLKTYERNADVVEGWIWVADLTRRTCIICWSQHGTFHEHKEQFMSHVRCRCAPAPAVRGNRLDIPTGSEEFRRLNEATQRKMLGRTRFEDFKVNGRDLGDYVRVVHDPVYGDTLAITPGR